MAWIGSKYPLDTVSVTTDCLVESGSRTTEAQAPADLLEQEQACGYGGRPSDRRDHHTWAYFVGMAVDWTYSVRWDGKLRNRVAHTGGHFADYARSEMLVRAGFPIQKWTVVFNGVYKHVSTST